MVDNNIDGLKRLLEITDRLTPNHKHAAFVDLRLTGDKERFFKVDLQNRVITYSWFTSHGRGSGSPIKAHTFSNKPGSFMSSPGIYRTAEEYFSSKFGRALRLDGLSPGLNDNARSRAIVLHRARYVDPSYIQLKKYAGCSEGCITLCTNDADWIMDDLKGGSLILTIT